MTPQQPADVTPGETGPASPLLALGQTVSHLPELDFRNRRELHDRFDARLSPVLWIHGDDGVGKTSLLRIVLSEQARDRRIRGVLRIECWPGLRLEEALFTIGDFLEQLGISDLGDVLLQRTTLASKIRVLGELLCKEPIWLWFDDFQNLSGSSGNGEQSGIEHLVNSWAWLDGDAGRIVVVTPGSGPDGITAEDAAADVLELSSADLLDAGELWEHWRGDGPRGFVPEDPYDVACLDDLAPGLRTPLALRLVKLACRAAAGHDADAGEWLRRVTASTGPDELISEIRESLGQEARRALDLLALHGRPLSRSTIRFLEEEWDLTGLESRGVDELTRAGLLDVEDDGHRLSLHPVIRKVTWRRSRADDLQQCKQAHRGLAARLLMTASGSRSLWGFYAAFLHLMQAGLYEEAYETQKAFSEEFLGAGLTSLARSVFEECMEKVDSPYREIIVGNLAVVHKSEGRYDEAIALYTDSLERFSEAGDLANAARVHHQIGNTYYLKGDFFRARENYSISQEIASSIDDRGILFLARVQLANLQFSTGEMEPALEAYETAVKLAEEIGNTNMVTSLHIQMAQVHVSCKRHEQARDELDFASRLAADKDDLRNQLRIEQLRGLMARTTRDYDEAVRCFRRAADHARALGDPVEQANCRIHVGVSEGQRLRYGDAVRAFLEARGLLKRLAGEPLQETDRETMAQNIASVEEKIHGVREEVGEEAFVRILQTLSSGISD